MSEHDWLEPLDRRIKQTREETEAIKKETAAIMNLIATFKVPVTFSLSIEQQKEARQAVNCFYLGDPECNVLNPETMQYEAKYPQKETSEFKKACRNVAQATTEYLTIGLDSSGRLSILNP
jgi:hypothetical protein